MTSPNPSERTWLDLSIEELEQILTTGTVPSNLGWGTLPQHPEFSKIFRVREQPARIAKILLDNIIKASGIKPPPKGGHQKITYVPALSPEYREQRLILKREELEMQKGKQKNQTVMFEKICQLETDLNTVRRYLKDVLSVVRDLDARSRRAAAK